MSFFHPENATLIVFPRCGSQPVILYMIQSCERLTGLHSWVPSKVSLRVLGVVLEPCIASDWRIWSVYIVDRLSNHTWARNAACLIEAVIPIFASSGSFWGSRTGQGTFPFKKAPEGNPFRRCAFFFLEAQCSSWKGGPISGTFFWNFIL